MSHEPECAPELDSSGQKATGEPPPAPDADLPPFDLQAHLDAQERAILVRALNETPIQPNPGGTATGDDAANPLPHRPTQD